MRSYDKYRETSYIQKSDVEKGILVTIDQIKEEDVSSPGFAEKIKYVIYFKEDYKPWVPSISSLEEIRSITGTGNVDEWPGTLIVLYVNPDVEFAGKKVGGIRCRAPKAGYTKNQQINNETVQQAPEPDEDDIPF